MNKIQSSKKIQLFFERYDGGADARLDGTLEKPLGGGTKSAPIVYRFSIHKETGQRFHKNTQVN